MQSNDHIDTEINTGKPLVLIVLDGWGHRDSCEANALCYARLPVWERLWKTCPHTLVSGSGMDVGLPNGQMGNSEVGHMAIGAGRVIYQSLTRLNKAIEDGEFLANPAYCAAIDKVVATGKALHIFGLLSPGGVHSHEDHIIAMINMAVSRGAQHVYVHAFLDGRDTPPRSAEPSLVKTEQCLRDQGVGRVATVCGRYYAMDRDNRWERVRPVYEMLTEGRAEFCASDPITALQNGYARDENDEFIKPTVVGGPDDPSAVIRDGDAIIFMNFRPDRAREITRTFTEDSFSGFQRAVRPALSSFVMTTEYAADIHANTAFYADSLANGLGEYLAAQGKTQLRIAETEKYAHVTFFFSGGREAEYAGEDRILVPSPNVATYDLKPEMSAFEVTDALVAAIHSGKYDVIICNFANGDMVGHTGNFDAAVKAVEAVDVCLGRVTEALLKVGGECLITADHGNVELMLDPDTHQPHTAHTCEMVPLIYVGNRAISFTGTGTLVDVAPSMLALIGLSQPHEMTGRSLVAVPTI